MEKKNANSNEKKYISKAKSCNESAPKAQNESNKRNAFSVNEAVMSLDLALGRLKRSKLVSVSSGAVGATSDVFYDATSPSIGNASMLSVNFSHYELMRNLSRCTSNSEGAFSGATCNTFCVDSSLKDEHLEKYFRSVDLWRRKHPPNGDTTTGPGSPSYRNVSPNN